MGKNNNNSEKTLSPHLSSAKSRRFESCSSACLVEPPCVQFGGCINRQSEKDSPQQDSRGHRTRTECCGDSCCFKYDKNDKIDKIEKKASTRPKKPDRIDISSMSGADLRSVVSSQIVMMNLLSESIAQLTEYADKVLLEDITKDLSMKRLLCDNMLQKEILKKMNYIINLTDSSIEPVPEPKPKQLAKMDPKLEAKLQAALELASVPLLKKKLKEPKGEARALAKRLLKWQPKVEPKVEPKGQSKGQSKGEPKGQSKGEPKEEPKEELKKELKEELKKEPKEEPKTESKEEPIKKPKEELIKKPKEDPNKKPKEEANKKPTEEAKGKPKENSILKLESKKTKEQNHVESEIHNKVILPMIHRIQRAYLTNMEDQLQLMNYLESMPSTLINMFKDHTTPKKQEKQ